MNNVVIYINWEYFLGLVGTLIALAYYANGRFTRIETSVEWLTETLRDLKLSSENNSAKLFSVRSPISLTTRGRHVLILSGLKSYIDDHKGQLIAQCRRTHSSDPYELQISAFRLLAGSAFGRPFEQQLNKFAFTNGVSADLLRRIGAIYLRDILNGSF